MQPKAISVDSESAFVKHPCMESVPKLEMIARRLNLSESTISRALNDYSDISKKTKKLVWTVANEMGYQPNIHARRLASGKSETVAYLLPVHESELGNSFVSELIAGMSSMLSEKGWDLTVLSPTTAEDETALFQKIARNRHISGLVISRTLVIDPRFEILNELDIPFITHGRSHASEETAWIDVDNIYDLIEISYEYKNNSENLKLATKYPNLVRRNLEKFDVNNIVFVSASGGLEAAPMIGYADIIADITVTGKTMKENNLKPLKDGTLFSSQACLISSSDIPSGLKKVYTQIINKLKSSGIK